MGENKDLMRYSDSSQNSFKVEAKVNIWSASASAGYASSHYNTKQKNTETSFKSRASGEAESVNSKTKSHIFEFTCRIRRYEIFLDEVTPDQLSEAFLQDYLALPIKYFDFRNRAPQKYNEFIRRWGTHYIKAASFGG